MKTIPSRQLRDRVDQVLRQVEAGERLRVTVAGRPVADLVPLPDVRRRFVSRDVLLRVLPRMGLDPAFREDLDSVAGATIDEV